MDSNLSSTGHYFTISEGSGSSNHINQSRPLLLNPVEGHDLSTIISAVPVPSIIDVSVPSKSSDSFPVTQGEFKSNIRNIHDKLSLIITH